MPDLIEMLKDRAQMIRLQGRVLTEKTVCGFTYRFERGIGFVRYGPNGHASSVNRSEVLDVFEPWQLAYVAPEERKEMRRSLALV